MQRPAASAQSCWLGRSAHVGPCYVPQPSNPFLCRKPLLKTCHSSNRRSAKGSPIYSRAGPTPPEVLADRSVLVVTTVLFAVCTSTSCRRTVAEVAFHRQEMLHPHQKGKFVVATSCFHVQVQNTPACPCQLIAILHRCNDQSGSTAQQRMVGA